MTLGPNSLAGVGKEMIDDPTYHVSRDEKLAVAPLEVPPYQAFGGNRPVGARPELRGRQNIIMTEWGPWDHVAPLARLVKSCRRVRSYEGPKVPARSGWKPG